uniref:SGNH domain-containing protein n=1 Tax=Panagrolaimus sp. JU765 TaxID=591449 RepID=A0AC34RA08_9BILA
MELLKPDVTIVSQRLDIFEHPNLKSRNDAKNDNFTKIYEKYWLEYSKFTKQIIIVEPYATFYKTDKESLIKLLRQSESLKDYFVSKNEMEKQVDSEWWRISESIVNCPICSTVDIRHHFCKGEKCDIYDASNNHLLYCDAGHLNSEGLARITPDIIKAIKKI